MGVTSKIDDLFDLICASTHDLLSPYGQFVCEVHEGFAHDGDDALFVDICYRLDAVPVPPEVTLELRSKLRGALLSRGDGRFPYIGYRLEQPEAA